MTGKAEDQTEDLAIAREDPRKADLRPLIQALDDYLTALYPPLSNHLLDIEALTRPEAAFFAARKAGKPLGIAALIAHADEGYGELKRMYVPPEARGQGVAKALLLTIEQEAHRQGLPRLCLETGVDQPEALALYKRYGFEECGPFGGYTVDPLSLFFEKHVNFPKYNSKHSYFLK
ncbi:GNAT family N-acetyltransferase [Limibacillus halophilus]|jgi:putative acetyltransferase